MSDPRLSETVAHLYDALAVLRQVQWSGDIDGFPSCPICGAPSADVAVEPYEATADAHPGKHEPSCKLAAVLRLPEAAVLPPSEE